MMTKGDFLEHLDSLKNHDKREYVYVPIPIDVYLKILNEILQSDFELSAYEDKVKDLIIGELNG